MRYALALLVLVACGGEPEIELSRESPLLDPGGARLEAPETFKVKFETTKGDFVVQFQSSWSPGGVDRIYNLVKLGYYDGTAFFRVMKGKWAQWGIHGDPAVNRAWSRMRIADEPSQYGNVRGTVTFARTPKRDSRTTQLFINLGDNRMLDRMRGFNPVGKVVEGMQTVDRLYRGYGDGPPEGRGPHQGTLEQRGNVYLKEEFPNLDYIKRATIVGE